MAFLSAFIISIGALVAGEGLAALALERHTNGHNGQIKDRVRTYLDENPNLEQLSINQVLAELRDAGIQVGRTTVADALQERRQDRV